MVTEARDLEPLKRLAEGLAAAPEAAGTGLTLLLTLLRSDASPQLRRAALLGAACTLAGTVRLPDVCDWWPAATADQRPRLAEAASVLSDLVDALPASDRAAAALAALVLVAPLDQDQAPMNLRRDLLQHVPPRDARRDLAEFLAVFRPALVPEGAPDPNRYPGLASELLRRIEAQTVNVELVDHYLQDLALPDDPKWRRAISARGVLKSRVKAYGLPEGDSLEAVLELAKAEGHGAGLNRLAALAEDDDTVAGTIEAREQLFKIALEEAKENLNQSREAFLRLLRHAQQSWEPEMVRSWLAEWCNRGHRTVRLLASIEYALAMLDTVETADELPELLRPLLANLQAPGGAAPELAGEVLFLLRELRQRFGEDIALPELPIPAVEPPPQAAPPRRLRLLVVGATKASVGMRFRSSRSAATR